MSVLGKFKVKWNQKHGDFPSAVPVKSASSLAPVAGSAVIVLEGWVDEPPVQDYMGGKELYVWNGPGSKWNKRTRAKVTIEIYDGK